MVRWWLFPILSNFPDVIKLTEFRKCKNSWESLKHHHRMRRQQLALLRKSRQWCPHTSLTFMADAILMSWGTTGPCQQAFRWAGIDGQQAPVTPRAGANPSLGVLAGPRTHLQTTEHSTVRERHSRDETAERLRFHPGGPSLTCWLWWELAAGYAQPHKGAHTWGMMSRPWGREPGMGPPLRSAVRHLQAWPTPWLQSRGAPGEPVQVHGHCEGASVCFGVTCYPAIDAGDGHDGISPNLIWSKNMLDFMKLRSVV